jgi:hypothetical protein
VLQKSDTSLIGQSKCRSWIKIRILRLKLAANPCCPSLLTTHFPATCALAFSLRLDAGSSKRDPYCKRQHGFPLLKPSMSSFVNTCNTACHLDLIVQRSLSDITFINHFPFVGSKSALLVAVPFPPAPFYPPSSSYLCHQS